MTKTITYAGRLERLFANLIDTLILFVPASIVALMLSSPGADGEPVVAPASLLIIFLINLGYYTFFTSGAWQATPGKRMLNMHVIRVDRQPITQRDALERFLAYVLPSLPMYASFLPSSVAPMLVIWLSIFWFAPILSHPQRAGFHDKLCRTRVVSGRAS
jgi:uncharacterized RDD family membrane protein YckC